MTDDDEEQIDQAFRVFDADRTGNVRYRELKAALRAFGFEVKKVDVLRLLDDQGKRRDDPIDIETFREILREALVHRDPLDRVHQCFRLIDVDETGKINLRCLKRLCKEIGVAIDDEELQDMIDAFDSDKDGFIDRADFERIMAAESDSE